MIGLFGKHVVGAGLIEPEYGRMLNRAFELRQKSDYEVFSTIGLEEEQDVVGKAGAFVRKVKWLSVK